jgi:hypothetical protein
MCAKIHKNWFRFIRYGISIDYVQLYKKFRYIAQQVLHCNSPNQLIQ